MSSASDCIWSSSSVESLLTRGGDHIQQPLALRGIAVLRSSFFEIARKPRAGGAHRRQRHQSPPDEIAVAIEEGLFLAVDKGGGAGMHGDRGVLVGVRRLDLRGQRKFVLQRLPDREQLPGKGGDGGFRHAFARHDVVREADGLDLLFRLVRRAAKGAGGNFRGLIGRMVLRDRLGRVDGEEWSACRRRGSTPRWRLP